MTPLGKPVLPDVYKTTATSSSLAFNSWWKEDELAYGVEHSEVKLIFVDQKRYDLAKNLNVNLVVSGNVDGAASMEEALNTSADDWPELNGTQVMPLPATPRKAITHSIEFCMQIPTLSPGFKFCLAR